MPESSSTAGVIEALVPAYEDSVSSGRLGDASLETRPR